MLYFTLLIIDIYCDLTKQNNKKQKKKMSSQVPQEFLCPISMNVMVNPVVIDCGHSFDKEGLETWLRSSNLCPTCRHRVTTISTNFTLKSLIESSLNNTTRPNSGASYIQTTNTGDDEGPVLKTEKTNIDLGLLSKITATYEELPEDLVKVCLKTPQLKQRLGISFVCVIDVSGSMGSIVGAGEGGKAFTRLDLVKHVPNVLIVSLKSCDTLALITFSNETKLVLSSAFMTEQNKVIFKRQVERLETEASTYTGQAIQKAYQVNIYIKLHGYS